TSADRAAAQDLAAASLGSGPLLPRLPRPLSVRHRARCRPAAASHALGLATPAEGPELGPAEGEPPTDGQAGSLRVIDRVEPSPQGFSIVGSPSARRSWSSAPGRWQVCPGD